MTDADLINRLRDEAFNPRNNLAAQVEFIRAAEALSGLQAENQRLREALAFYADVARYPAPLTGGAGDLYFDCGQRARDALRRTEGG